MPGEVKLLPCTQADREAAANIVEWQSGTGWEPQFFHPAMPKGIREGAWDNHPIVQAFAAHTRPTTVVSGQAEDVAALLERGARQLYRDYENTTKEHVELIFSSEDAECKSLADEMREWFRAAVDASGLSDRIAVLEDKLAEAYKRGWREGCETLLEDEEREGFAAMPHKDAMGEGCGNFMSEHYASLIKGGSR